MAAERGVDTGGGWRRNRGREGPGVVKVLIRLRTADRSSAGRCGSHVRHEVCSPERPSLDEKAGEINKYLAIGLSRRAIAKLCGCSPTTLYAWLKLRRPEVLETKKGDACNPAEGAQVE